eukprot:gnl/TRDRNA2_/TRDRNA2_157097_c0_seq3.p1 gnl/TRDRNA2_/TRDRNA2_157097_c0~~gnl/TRDRNA2_/TRDRNA2_157097_c0_seq3.p1  ORF type:complete len:171 (+),score=9.75 gnl/TRDRNA2_/TRDRNA2_157097_c0_seq3:3-515(+)
MASEARLNGVRTTSGNDSPLIFHHGFVGGSAKEAEKNHQSYANEDHWGVKYDPNAKLAKKISLGNLFKRYHVPCEVDMVDIDIQGAEFSLLSYGTIGFLTKRIRRVHVGTHSNKTAALRGMFLRHGWKLVWDFTKTYISNTGTGMWGPVVFGDGALSFLNTKQIECEGPT